MTLHRLVPVLLLAAACSSTPNDGVDADDPLPPPPEGEGFQMAMSVEAPPASEIWKCKVDQIPTDEWMPINRAESLQNAGMHHMDIMALALAGVDIEPGLYDCDEIYDTYPELMDDGIFLYAAQAENQVIQLPEGTVANLPPALTIMHEVHYVNTSDQPVEVFSKVNAYAIHPGDIQETIWGQSVRDLDLEIPPATEHSEWTRCVMNEDIDLLFLSSHTHELGKEVVVRLFDGETVGEEVHRNTDWQTPALKAFDTPLHIPAGQGFEFECVFENYREDTVTWGFGAQDEMCQIALVYTPGEATRKCEPVETSDGLGL